MPSPYLLAEITYQLILPPPETYATCFERINEAFHNRLASGSPKLINDRKAGTVTFSISYKGESLHTATEATSTVSKLLTAIMHDAEAQGEIIAVHLQKKHR